MRILLVSETYLPFIAGVSSSTDSIARFLCRQGHTVCLVSPKPVLNTPFEVVQNLTYVHTPSIADITYKGKPMTLFPFAFPVLIKLFKQHRFDVVHIQEPGSVGVCALIVARRARIPTVGALHFTPDQVARMVTGRKNTLIEWLVERYIALIYSKYTAIMVPTQTFADFLGSLGVKKPITVVSNGVDTNLYVPTKRNETVRKRYDISPDETLFFYLGRIDDDKNVATVVLAMQHVTPNVRLLIAGNGKLKNTLINRAKKLGIDKKIIWLGNISQSEMIELYHAADVFVIMAQFEIQSIVTLQALASGLPVIAARAGALPELAHDGENGYLVDTFDDKKLAEKMNYLAQHPELRQTMGMVSREISLAHHKPTVLARLEMLYETVIASANRKQ